MEIHVPVGVIFLLWLSNASRAYGGIISLTQTTKPNAGQPVTVVCQANSTAPPAQDAVTLTGPEGPVAVSESSVVDNVRTTSFEVTVDEPNIEYVCTLLNGSTVIEQKSINVSVFELPYLRTPPTAAFNYFAPRNTTISWLPWETDGGGDGPIIGYQVLYRYASNISGDSSYDFSLTVDSNTTGSVVISNLDVETEYDFAVVVVRVGEDGAGPPTNKTTYETSCITPSAPPTLSVTRTETDELEIAWELPPASTWGCSALGPTFYLQWKIASADYFSLVFADLEPGSYNFTSLYPCRTYNFYGIFQVAKFGLVSPNSEVISPSTGRTVPEPINSLSMSNVENSMDLAVSWNDPFIPWCTDQIYITLTPVRQIACGTDILSPVTESQVVAANVTQVIFEDLLPYTEYLATVTTSNELGNSTEETRTHNTRETLPTGLPAVQVADVSPYSARLTWPRIPCEDIHGSFYYYNLRFTDNQTQEQFVKRVSDVDVPELTVSTLTPCKTYNVEIQVETRAGSGPWSETSQFMTPPVVPYIVENIVGSPVDDDPNALNVTWDVPNMVYCPIDYYQVSYELLYKFQCDITDGERIVAANTTELSYTLTGLFPYSTHRVYVRAHSDAGFGQERGTGVLITAQKAPTDTPINVMVASVTEDWLHFSFLRADCSEGSWSSRLVSYAYQLENLDNTSQPVTGSGLEQYLRFENLIPYTRYSFRVLIRTEAGDGPYSEPVIGRTREDEPGPLAGLTILNKTETTMDVAWEAPTMPNGIILNYTVQYRAIEKPYDPTFYPINQYVEAASVGPAVFTHTIGYLEPGTKYEVRVAAVTSPGAGEYVYREAFTELKSDIPEPEKPEFDPSRSTGTTVYIYIISPDTSYVTSFLVAVKKTSARRKRTGVVIDGESYGTFDENPDAYIAAEVEKESDNVVGFVVGDGRMYGDYLNAPLQRGMYSIRVGAMSEADGASSVSWSDPLTREATGPVITSPSPTTKKPQVTKDPGRPMGSNTVGIIAGVIIAVVVVGIIIGLVVYYMRMRKKREVENYNNDGTPMEETGKKDSVKI